jgi:hypothetical protein
MQHMQRTGNCVDMRSVVCTHSHMRFRH